ncbi:MAG: flavin reductase, partial [candidate division Zixibacteria bacterium]|nr:flavin reductase [candidate division Zixibacteria bacterium]
TPAPASQVASPLIAECPVNIECKVTQSIVLGTHELFIGEIVTIQIDEDCVDDQGRVDIARVKPFVYVPTTTEYIGGIERVMGHGGFAIKKS